MNIFEIVRQWIAANERRESVFQRRQEADAALATANKELDQILSDLKLWLDASGESERVVSVNGGVFMAANHGHTSVRKLLVETEPDA